MTRLYYLNKRAKYRNDNNEAFKITTDMSSHIGHNEETYRDPYQGFLRVSAIKEV